MNVEIRKLTDEEYRLSMYLFIGKVSDELGFDKTVDLLTESKLAIIEGSDKTKEKE